MISHPKCICVFEISFNLSTSFVNILSVDPSPMMLGRLTTWLCGGVPRRAVLTTVLCSLCDQHPEDQRLIYSGKLLLDHQCLRDLLPKVRPHTVSVGCAQGTSPAEHHPKAPPHAFSRKSGMFCTWCAT